MGGSLLAYGGSAVGIGAPSSPGAAVSAGCLHATEAEARYLMRTVPLGTPVEISP